MNNDFSKNNLLGNEFGDNEISSFAKSNDMTVTKKFCKKVWTFFKY